MEVFPFKNAEWHILKSLADSILTASLAEDDAVAVSLRLNMLEALADLRERHGDHPVLIETIADYTEDAGERALLYRQAIEIAEAHGLPTLNIRLALARVLAIFLGESAAALEELWACGSEASRGDESERAEWASLLGDAATEADAAERASIFRRAMGIATAYGQPFLRLRLLFVRFLLDEEQSEAALEELRTCRSEALESDEENRTFWAQLREEASQAEPRGGPDRGPD